MQVRDPGHVDVEGDPLRSHGGSSRMACGRRVQTARAGAWPPPCEALLRLMAALGLALLGAGVAGCTVEPALPSWAAPSIEGNEGVSAALAVSAHAASITRAMDALPSSTCRARSGQQGWMQSQVRVEYVRKHRSLPSERLVETIDWRQDDDGDVASRRTMTSRLPDGRFAVRSVETRRVGQRWYRGLDGHFADAARIANIDGELQEERFRLVDELLSTVRLQGGVLTHASALHGSLCGPAHTVDLTASVTGRVRWRVDGRSGWIRWVDEHGTSVTVQFVEQLSLSAGAEVEAPEQVFRVERDPSWEDIQALVQLGMAEGWLGAPREVRPQE